MDMESEVKTRVCATLVCNIPDNHREYLAVKNVDGELWYWGSADRYEDAAKFCRDESDIIIAHDMDVKTLLSLAQGKFHDKKCIHDCKNCKYGLCPLNAINELIEYWEGDTDE